MKKIVRLTESDLVRLVNRVIKEQSESYNMIKPCASLGVKSPGKCDTIRKMPVESCAKLGLKTVGLCYVDTKKPVPKLPSMNKMNEQSENPNAGNDAKVQNLIKEGYKVVPKFNLPDGEYELSGWGYTCYVNKDGKNTGYAYVTTGGIRGSWLGKMINIVSGQIEKIMFGDVYKILFNQTEVGKPKSEL